MSSSFHRSARAILSAGLAILILVLPSCERKVKPGEEGEITAESIGEAQRLIGLDFDKAERDSMLEAVSEHLEGYETLREVEIDNSVPPALQFSVLAPPTAREERANPPVPIPPGGVQRPADSSQLAFMSVLELSELVRSRQVTSVELTMLYIDRLKQFGPKLECVVTLTEDLAMQQARRADKEIAEGTYRGPLHGIPYGLKDLFAVPGYPTTWGAMPYKDQVRDETATVARKLEDAGAVLVAKLTLGALAWGDVWFGGKTRNPWNTEQGSSGSSAGSAAATSAGLVGFALGTETWGSIVSPCTRCGVTGLRPTFGRVSRAGAMALSWSMDKVGPICRTVDDCALVFSAIQGPDGIDRTVVDRPFSYDPQLDVRRLRVGYAKDLFDEEYDNKANDLASLDTLRSLGVKLIPVSLPDLPVEPMAMILEAEAAAAFDELTRSGRDSLMVRQISNAWPNVFRAARFIPAVDYIQANRLRTMVMRDMERVMSKVDVYVAPSFGGDNLLLTNLTGHPCVVVPNGFTEEGSPTSISFIGALYDEASVLAVARAYQEASGFYKKHPPGYE
jgi:Asp-tRNA(Asn)/Glu-tRNA(Gln) amidotransferase A subunit family amidase